MSGATTARRHGGNPLRSLPRRATQQRWARKLHTWLSMVSLVLVLFFGATGFLLNHPDWTFGQQPATTTATGTLPSSVDADDVAAVSSWLRDQGQLLGELQSSTTSGTSLMAGASGPGVSSQLSVDTSTGEYTATVTRSGVVAFVSDLHRGNAVGTAWGWVIDATAIVLVLIALTGLAIGLLNRSRHWARDMGLAAAGLAAAVVLLVVSAP